MRVSYESRRLFAELDKAQSEERALDNDSERLKTELRSQATPLRVERTAREQPRDARGDAGGDAVRRAARGGRRYRRRRHDGATQ